MQAGGRAVPGALGAEHGAERAEGMAGAGHAGGGARSGQQAGWWVCGQSPPVLAIANRHQAWPRDGRVMDGASFRGCLLPWGAAGSRRPWALHSLAGAGVNAEQRERGGQRDSVPRAPWELERGA